MSRQLFITHCPLGFLLILVLIALEFIIVLAPGLLFPTVGPLVVPSLNLFSSRFTSFSLNYRTLVLVLPLYFVVPAVDMVVLPLARSCSNFNSKPFVVLVVLALRLALLSTF